MDYARSNNVLVHKPKQKLRVPHTLSEKNVLTHEPAAKQYTTHSCMKAMCSYKKRNACAGLASTETNILQTHVSNHTINWTHVMGSDLPWCLYQSAGKLSHLKCIPQLKPPRTMGDASYSKVSWSMMSTIGMVTVDELSWIRLSSGCSHSTFTSQCESRNTNTWKPQFKCTTLWISCIVDPQNVNKRTYPDGMPIKGCMLATEGFTLKNVPTLGSKHCWSQNGKKCKT